MSDVLKIQMKRKKGQPLRRLDGGSLNILKSFSGLDKVYSKFI